MVFPGSRYAIIRSWSPKAGHNKAGRSDFGNQRFEPDAGKMRKMRKVPLTPEKQGYEEIPQSENEENADTKTRKMQKMRMTGFNVTDFRLTGQGPTMVFGHDPQRPLTAYSGLERCFAKCCFPQPLGCQGMPLNASQRQRARGPLILRICPSPNTLETRTRKANGLEILSTPCRLIWHVTVPQPTWAGSTTPAHKGSTEFCALPHPDHQCTAPVK